MGLPADVQVALLERTTNRQVTVLSQWSRIEWTERWRAHGTGRLDVRWPDLPSDIDTLLLSGGAAVEIRCTTTTDGGEQRIDQISGPVTIVRASSGRDERLEFPFHGVRNEIVAGGAEVDPPSAREIVRRFDAGSQTALGCRERWLDARNATLTAEIEADADTELAAGIETGDVGSLGGNPGPEGFLCQIHFADHKLYLSHRLVDTDGVNSVNPNTTAGAYIQALVDDNLLDPESAAHGNLARRKIQEAATFAAPGAVGATVNRRIRWELLSEAVRDACVLGGVGITSRVRSDRVVEYAVTAINDRSLTGSGNAVILSPDVDFHVAPGDRVRAQAFLRGRDSPAAEINIARLCTARTITLQPGRVTSIRHQFGDPINEAKLLRDANRRLQAAAAV